MRPVDPAWIDKLPAMESLEDAMLNAYEKTDHHVAGSRVQLFPSSAEVRRDLHAGLRVAPQGRVRGLRGRFCGPHPLPIPSDQLSRG